MTATQIDPLRQIMQSAFTDVTPVRLRLFLIGNWVAVLAFCIVASATIGQNEHAARTVRYDAAPSVFAAHKIQHGLNQMDTFVSGELLYAAHKEEGKLMAGSFEDERADVCKQLVAAAENITYGTAEQVPLENIQIALGKYLMQVQTARDHHQSGRDVDALNSYRVGFQTLKTELLPETRKLNDANASRLDAVYAQEKSESALSCGLVLVVGMLLLALLLTTQIYLAMRFRRRLNIHLLVATACMLFIVQQLNGALRESSRQLKIAKEDSYDSIVALLAARTRACDANAAEIRWLLDRNNAGDHERTFAEDSAAIAAFSGDHDASETIERAQRDLERGEKINLQGFSGALAKEFSNIRFEGEAEAALQALQAWNDYLRIDKEMRHLEASGSHDAAVALGLGYNPNASEFYFSRFDDAIERAIGINQKHFDQAVRDSVNVVRGLTVLAQIGSLLVAVLVYLGLRPRIAEYLPSDYLRR